MYKVFLAASLIASSAALAVDQDILDKYNNSCVNCHATGVSGAPITHNDQHWAPRLEKGLSRLLISVLFGLNAMPAGGLCFNCSDSDYIALIKYMSNYPEPPPPPEEIEESNILLLLIGHKMKQSEP